MHWNYKITNLPPKVDVCMCSRGNWATNGCILNGEENAGVKTSGNNIAGMVCVPKCINVKRVARGQQWDQIKYSIFHGGWGKQRCDTPFPDVQTLVQDTVLTKPSPYRYRFIQAQPTIVNVNELRVMRWHLIVEFVALLVRLRLIWWAREGGCSSCFQVLSFCL